MYGLAPSSLVRPGRSPRGGEPTYPTDGKKFSAYTTRRTSGCAFLAQCCNRFIENGFERRFVGYSQIGECFTINFNFSGSQSFHEAAVGCPELPACRIDSLDPKVAKVSLAGLSIPVRPIFGLHRRVFSISKQLGPTTSVAFRSSEDSFAALSACRRIRCSRHSINPVLTGHLVAQAVASRFVLRPHLLHQLPVLEQVENNSLALNETANLL